MKSFFLQVGQKLRSIALDRLPKVSEIIPVFAIIATLFYGWTMVVFLWKLPGWLFFLNIGEIAGVFAFQLVTNLIESLVVLLALLIFSMVFPPRVLRDVFIVRAGMAALVLIGSMMLFLNRYVSAGAAFGSALILWMIVTIILAAMLMMLSTRVRFLGTSILWISDRLTIFLFILMPLSMLSLIYILLRFFISG
jgi:hypothetical protein